MMSNTRGGGWVDSTIPRVDSLKIQLWEQGSNNESEERMFFLQDLPTRMYSLYNPIDVSNSAAGGAQRKVYFKLLDVFYGKPCGGGGGTPPAPVSGDVVVNDEEPLKLSNTQHPSTEIVVDYQSLFDNTFRHRPPSPSSVTPLMSQPSLLYPPSPPPPPPPPAAPAPVTTTTMTTTTGSATGTSSTSKRPSSSSSSSSTSKTPKTTPRQRRSGGQGPAADRKSVV